LQLAYGIWASKGIKNIDGFSVASRSFGPWVIFATLSASFIGGGFSLGNAEKVFTFGIANIVALWGFSLKEMLVAKFLSPKIINFPKAISVGDILETNYGKTGKLTAGIFGTMLCIGILSAQVLAIGYVFNLFLGVSQTTGALLGCTIIIIYSTVGGMLAVVKTDIIQFIVLAIGLPLTLIFGINACGGVDNIIANIPASRFNIPAEGHSWLAFFSLFCSFILGETLVPPYVQRLCIGKDTKAVQKGTMMAGIFSIPFFTVTGLIGLVALHLNPELDPNLAIPYVVNESVPVILKGIVIAGIISIAMSSADSFLNAASVSIVNDIIQPLRTNKLSDSRELLFAKIATAVCGILSVILALNFNSILGLLMYAYDFWSPIVLMPLLLTIIGKNIQTKSFVSGAVIGLIIMVVWNRILNQPYEINALPIAVFANGMTIYMVEKLSKMQTQQLSSEYNYS